MPMDMLQQKAFEYFGALAFVIVGLMFALAFVTNKWLKSLETITEMHAARLSDAKEQAKVGEAMRDTMAANTTALQANSDLVKTVLSRRDDR